MGDKRELEQTWRLPLKKLLISSWLAELVIQAGVPKEDIEAIHDRHRSRSFRVLIVFAKELIGLSCYTLRNAYKRSRLRPIRVVAV